MSTSEPDLCPVREGDVLAGKYRIETVLGAGGMGVVVAATHLKLGTRVAIKFLHPSVCQVPEAVERFLREARAAARIEGEHVARVTDVATLDSGAPYMVMEFLRGADLAAVLKKDGPLQVEPAVAYILQACEAIAEAHRMSLVHRDLKPSNIFLTRRSDGTALVKVLDFGISKTLDTARSSLLPGAITDPASSIGSPLYMSPEQIRGGGGVDHRTDVWALGVVLYELLAGRPPFVRDTLPALYVAIAQEPAPPLRLARPEVPEQLERVVARCLEKDPAFRMQSVADLAQSLLPIAPPDARPSIERILRIANTQSPFATTTDPLSAVDVHAPTRPLPAVEGSGPRSATQSAWGATRRSALTRMAPRAAVGAVALALVWGAVVLLPKWTDGGSVRSDATGEASPASGVPVGVPQVTTLGSATAAPSPPAALSLSASASTSPAASALAADAAVPMPSGASSAKSKSPPPARDTTKKGPVPTGHDGLDDRN